MKYALLIGFIAIALIAESHAIEHIVEYVWPRGAARGETVEVELHGLYLDDPVEVVSYDPGIRCLSVESPQAVDDKEA